jgi:hypothetical protein
MVSHGLLQASGPYFALNRKRFSVRIAHYALRKSQTLETEALRTHTTRVGLARSRHDVAGDESASKKAKTQPRGWSHDHVHQVEGKWLCKHCDQGVSNTNQTRRKEHLLKCSKFLSSDAAEKSAASSRDEALKQAVEQHKQ